MTETMLQQLVSIRDEGRTNMFDYAKVMEICKEKGYWELHSYIKKSPSRYCNFILTGTEQK